MTFIQLDITAIRQSDSQNNAYVLLLNEFGGERQLPIVIGWCEARSIAIALDSTEQLSRPLTHDLFKTLGDSFDITVQKVVIHTLIEGVFHAAFHCKHKTTGKDVKIDARTSDAIAIAIRYKCPIFTHEDILARAGIIINNIQDKKTDLYLDDEEDKNTEIQAISTFSFEKLNQLLDIAIQEEDYEKAAEIRDELKKRNNN